MTHKKKPPGITRSKIERDMNRRLNQRRKNQRRRMRNKLQRDIRERFKDFGERET